MARVSGSAENCNEKPNSRLFGGGVYRVYGVHGVHEVHEVYEVYEV